MTDDKTLRGPSIGADALKAFAHPLRMAMYRSLRNDGPATASMLGRALGESSGQTSYHLRQLERHGFVEDDPGHTGGRERWWRAVGFSMDSADLLVDPATASSARAVMQAMVAERSQELAAWVEEVDLDWEAQVMSSTGLDLTQHEARRLIERMLEVVDEYKELSDARGEGGADAARRVRVHLDVFPVRHGRPGEG